MNIPDIVTHIFAVIGLIVVLAIVGTYLLYFLMDLADKQNELSRRWSAYRREAKRKRQQKKAELAHE